MAVKIINSKRSVFFTIISIILVAGLVYFYVSSQKPNPEDISYTIETRVRTMDSLIDDIQHDIERGLYISSIRSLVGMAEYMTENGSFLKDFDSCFNELMLNGTVKGNILNITKNASFGDWMTKIEDIGYKLNVYVSFSEMNVTPYHNSPWSIRVNFAGIMNLSDTTTIASWSRRMNITTTIDITEFEDPMYTVTSQGKLTNSIIMSNVTYFVSGNDASNLEKHANNSWYIASASAPSFLMRFAGNFSPSQYGIESIVNIDEVKVAAPEIYKAGRSSVDYLFFGNSSVSSCKVNETKDSLSWFRLDDAHLPVYEANCE